MTSHELATLALVHARSELLYERTPHFQFAIRRLIGAGLVDQKVTRTAERWRCTPIGREVIQHALDDAKEQTELTQKLSASLRRAVRAKGKR